MLSVYESAAVLLVLTATFGWLNLRILRLPHAVGLLVSGVATSAVLVGVEAMLPGGRVNGALVHAVLEVDFKGVVMDGMLAFLLFAGALNVDIEALRTWAVAVAVLALLGTLLSTLFVGVAFWTVAQLLASPLPFSWALLFGALISPTDPVAVLAMLKRMSLPTRLRVELEGEALFNDGVGVVLFTLLLGFVGAGGAAMAAGPADIIRLAFREIAGGLILGVATGSVAYKAMRTVDDFPVEVLITLALATATYALADRLGASGPLAVVAAGVLIGNRGRRFAMSDRTQGYVTAVWTVIDEVLNSLLFLLIGLEVLVLQTVEVPLGLPLAAVPIALAARALALAVPLLISPLRSQISSRNIPFLTWAGVRGGISVALALSLPEALEKPVLLGATYAVVLFTIVVQSTTLPRLASSSLGSRRNDDD